MKVSHCLSSMISALGILLQFSAVHSQDNVNRPPEADENPCPLLHPVDPQVRPLTLLHADENDVDGRLCCLCPRGTFLAGICNETIPQSDIQFDTTVCTPCPEGTYMEDELHENKACSLPKLTEKNCGKNMQFISSMAGHAPRCDCLDGYFKSHGKCVPFTPCELNHEVDQFGSPDSDHKCRPCRPGYKSEGGASRCTITRKPPDTTPKQPPMTTPASMSTVIEENPLDLDPGEPNTHGWEVPVVVIVGIVFLIGAGALVLLYFCCCGPRTYTSCQLTSYHTKDDKLSVKDSSTSGGSTESSPDSSNSRLEEVVVGKPDVKAVNNGNRSISKHGKESDSQEEAVPLISEEPQKPCLKQTKHLKSVSTGDVPPVQFRSSKKGLFKRKRSASENKAYENGERCSKSEYNDEVSNKVKAEPIVGTIVENQGAAHGASHSSSRTEDTGPGSAIAAQLALQEKMKHMDSFLKAEDSMRRAEWKRFADLCGLSPSVIEDAERGVSTAEFRYNIICKLRQTKGSDFDEAYIVNRLEAADLRSVSENFQAHMRNDSQEIPSCSVEVDEDDNP